MLAVVGTEATSCSSCLVLDTFGVDGPEVETFVRRLAVFGDMAKVLVGEALCLVSGNCVSVLYEAASSTCCSLQLGNSSSSKISIT